MFYELSRKVSFRQGHVAKMQDVLGVGTNAGRVSMLWESVEI